MIKGMTDYGAYIIEQKNPDTEGLRIYKDTSMKPSEKFRKFLDMVNPEDTKVPGWMKFEHDGDIFFIKKKSLYTILLTLANNGTVYYWGPFGTGKTVVVSALMNKLFGRVVTFRMLRNMTPIELFGQYDPLAVHLTMQLLKNKVKGEVIESLKNDEEFKKENSYLYNNIINKGVINYDEYDYVLDMVNINYIMKHLPSIISKIKQVNFQFSNIGKALEENAVLIIDEIDKVTDYELTPLSSITQRKNRYVPIPDFGAIAFNQPVILLGNNKSITQFIGSRVVSVKREYLPKPLVEELLIHEGVSRSDVIQKIMRLYPRVEKGELTLRDIINIGIGLQEYYDYAESNGGIDPDVVSVILREEE